MNRSMSIVVGMISKADSNQLRRFQSALLITINIGEPIEKHNSEFMLQLSATFTIDNDNDCLLQISSKFIKLEKIFIISGQFEDIFRKS